MIQCSDRAILPPGNRTLLVSNWMTPVRQTSAWVEWWLWVAASAAWPVLGPPFAPEINDRKSMDAQTLHAPAEICSQAPGTAVPKERRAAHALIYIWILRWSVLGGLFYRGGSVFIAKCSRVGSAKKSITHTSERSLVSREDGDGTSAPAAKMGTKTTYQLPSRRHRGPRP